MAQYKALKSYYSESQKRILQDGEVFKVSDEKLVADLEESIKKHGDGFLEKLQVEKPKRTRKTKQGVNNNDEE